MLVEMTNWKSHLTGGKRVSEGEFDGYNNEKPEPEPETEPDTKRQRQEPGPGLTDGPGIFGPTDWQNYWDHFTIADHQILC
jgi:hypothetical protein